MEIMILEKEGQKFEIPISQNHKATFEKRYGEGSLQRIYTLLARDCNTFTEIGEIFSLTRERIRQIYKKYLAPYLPKKSGLERRRSCTLSHINFYGKKKGFPKHVLKVWGKARKLGFSVSHVNHAHNNTGGVFTLSKELLINGKRCKILCLHNYFQPHQDGPLYARTAIATKIDSCAFLIVVVNVKDISVPETYFIIPHGQLDDISIQKDRRGYMARFINLPITASKHTTRSQWRTYKNAWHLLA